MDVIQKVIQGYADLLDVSDRLTNTASYALARSLGFEKVGEMLFWEYELPDWKGFPIRPMEHDGWDSTARQL